MKLTIVFADAEIEKSPEGGGMPLLDAYFHNGVKGRAGRPDIVHNALTILRSSSIWKDVDVAVCTKNNEVIIPKKEFFIQNYVEFTHKIADLLSGLETAEYDIKKMTLRDYLKFLNPDKIVALSPEGGKISLKDVLSGNTALIIGAFPDGDYTSPVYDICDVAVSLGDEIMTVPEVLMRVLSILTD